MKPIDDIYLNRFGFKTTFKKLSGMSIVGTSVAHNPSEKWVTSTNFKRLE